MTSFRLTSLIPALLAGVLIGCSTQADDENANEAKPKGSKREKPRSAIKTAVDSNAEREVIAKAMEKLALRIFEYHEAFDVLPAAPFVWKDVGRPQPSWLAEMLHFMERRDLYEKRNRDKTWDDPAHKELAETELAFYNIGAPSKTHTRFRYYTGEGTPLNDTNPTTIGEISDKDSVIRTILFIYASPEHAVPWMKPGGIPFDPAKPEEAIKALGKIPPEGVPVAMCNGQVFRIYPNADPIEFAKMVRYNDDMPIDMLKATGDKRHLIR